jgi:hypothetical protein
MPTQRFSLGVTTYENKIYCIGGLSNGIIVGTNEVYDVSSNSWETKALMPTPRDRITANLVNGKIYVIGGDTLDGTGVLSVNEVYDITTNTWTKKAPAPTQVAGYASVTTGNKIYIIGGYAGADSPFLDYDATVEMLQIYDCNTDTWSSSTLSEYERNVSAGVTSGEFAPQKIYVVGTNKWIYSLDSKIWTQGEPIPKNYRDLEVAVVNDLLYAVGTDGSDGFTLRYTPFGFSGECPEASSGLPDSTVLVAAWLLL